jgi:anti-sigma28 factor (negative regulator of flagellin synthesis)
MMRMNPIKNTQKNELRPEHDTTTRETREKKERETEKEERVDPPLTQKITRSK